MSDSLVVKLGADTSEFKGAIASASGELKEMDGALGEAGKALEHFNENTNRIQHHLLNNFLGFEAINHIREWASEAIKGAMETREQFERLGKPIDDAKRSLAGFGDNLESVKHGAIELAGSFLSFFTRAGEGWGLLINRLRGVSDEQSKIGDEAARGAEEQEKRLAEAIKEHAEDAKKAKEIEKQLGEEQYKRGLALLSIAGQITAITERKVELESQLASITTDSDSDRLRAANLRLGIDKLDADVSAKQAEQLRQVAQDGLEWYKKQYQQQKELHDLKLQALAPEERLIQLKSEQSSLEAKIVQEKRNGVDTTADEIKGLKLRKDIEEAILAIIKKQNDEKKKAQDLNHFDTGILKISSGFQTYNDPGEQAEYEKNLVAQAKAEIQYEIADLQNKLNAYLASGSSLGKFEIPALQERIKALQSRSQHVQDFVFNPNYSDAAGKGIFASQVSTIGDPLGLQKKTTDTLTDISQGIKDTNNRLRIAGFGNGG